VASFNDDVSIRLNVGRVEENILEDTILLNGPVEIMHSQRLRD